MLPLNLKNQKLPSSMKVTPRKDISSHLGDFSLGLRGYSIDDLILKFFWGQRSLFQLRNTRRRRRPRCQISGFSKHCLPDPTYLLAVIFQRINRNQIMLKRNPSKGFSSFRTHMLPMLPFNWPEQEVNFCCSNTSNMRSTKYLEWPHWLAYRHESIRHSITPNTDPEYSLCLPGIES